MSLTASLAGINLMEHKQIVLCLDVGTKRIGVAKSDALGVAAYAYPFVLRTKDRKEFKELLKIIETENIQILLLGLPKNMDGSLGGSVEMVHAFADELKQHTALPVSYWDERLSTVEAERMMIDEADMSRKKRKLKIDSMAAQIILQSYLDKNKDSF